MSISFKAAWLRLMVALALCAPLVCAHAAKISDVRGTKHNLSVTGPGTVKATTETQVCVFCHTPHAATAGVTPLWNRQLSNATYTTYTSSSLDANAIQGTLDQPGGSSKLCLSCHDGTLAIGNVNVLGGKGSATAQGTQSITMQGVATGGVMPDGATPNTGFTRRLGVDLTNDHPISLTFNSALADRDGELQRVDANQKWPPDGSVLAVRGTGVKPKLPLEPTGVGNAGQVQCATCHDPHLRETDAAKGNQKFLRLNRFQEGTATDQFNVNQDIVCLACHNKNQGSGSWAYSAHANQLVANETYTVTAATQREFPPSLPVWKAGCLNCHDTHTVQGAKRLLREGTDSLTNPKSGGNPALEETCYQCHTDAATTIVSPTTEVPNIKTDFSLPRHMPIKSTEQGEATEQHDIGGGFTDGGFIDCSGPTNKCGADFLESRAKLQRRHAECTDCHNPHRVVRFRDFRGSPPGSLAGAPDAAGTHRHDETAGYTHSNIASGVLRGTWGVEPIYSSASFAALPLSFQVKRGDPGNSVDNSASAPHVTREYQICLKCHSNYAYNDNNLYPVGNRPDLGTVSGTPLGTNNLQQYTNQAKEFQAPLTHKGEVTTTDSGANSLFTTNNHRSWHPVMDNTGRTDAIRTTTSTSFRTPWNNAVGTQTMYCSDCHGSSTGPATVVPNGGENGSPWGPHGSTNNFILKGVWDGATGTNSRDVGGVQANALCFKCHNPQTYADRNGSGGTGFFNSDRGNLHAFHTDKIGRLHCSWCHTAVPHGWKNKALLVNLNDVGPEAGQAGGVEVAVRYNQGPYYLNSMLKVITFARSGNWSDTNCGSRSTGGGKDWMKNNCSSPP